MKEIPLTISSVAKNAGVGVETIRYYQRIGLIEEPQKPLTGYRIYPEYIVSRILFIKQVKEFGFSLSEIAILLEPCEGKCQETKELASRKLDQINNKKIDLDYMAYSLEKLIQSCDEHSVDHESSFINILNSG